MGFYKIKAEVHKAYDDNAKMIERPNRDKLKNVEFTIYSKTKGGAIGVASRKLAAEGYSHSGIEVVN